MSASATRPTLAPAALLREMALLGLLALLWGSSYFWAKIAIAEIPPLTLAGARVTIGAAVLLAALAMAGGGLPKGLRNWRLLFIQSLLNATLAWSLLAWGQQHIDSALASVLNSTSPLWVFLFTALVTRHEPTTWLRFAGAVFGLAGVALIIGPASLKGLGANVAGQAAAIVSAMLYAAATIHGQRLNHLPSLATAAGTMLCATLALVPASLIVDSPWRLSPSWDALLAAATLGVFCTGGAMLLYFRLLRSLGSLGVASQAYLRAGVGVGLGVAFLGETLTLTVGLGIAAALLGVALINLPARKPKTVT